MFILPRFRALTKICEITQISYRCSSLQLSVYPRQEIVEGISHFDVEVTEENVDEMAKVLIRQIKKSWNVSNLQRQDFKGGLSNKVIGYLPVTKKRWFNRFKLDRSDMVLIRIYGEKTDLVKDRARELRNIDELSKHNITSPLYCTFSNGYCCEYIDGKVCTPEDFRNEDILRHTASAMAELHTVDLSNEYLKYYKLESSLFENIDYYLNAIPSRYHTKELQTRFKENIFSVDHLRGEVESIFEVVSNFEGMAVSYCHNDFHPINLIFNERGEKLHVIDHERGAPNYSAYDIGNCFNEFAGLHNVDYALYPTRETQFWWLRLYLQKINEINGSDSVVTNSDVGFLRVQVEYMSLVSHLFWVAWSLFRAGYPVSNFDYMGYGITRINEYFRRKRDVKLVGLLD